MRDIQLWLRDRTTLRLEGRSLGEVEAFLRENGLTEADVLAVVFW